MWKISQMCCCDLTPPQTKKKKPQKTKIVPKNNSNWDGTFKNSNQWLRPVLDKDWHDISHSNYFYQEDQLQGIQASWIKWDTVLYSETLTCRNKWVISCATMILIHTLIIAPNCKVNSPILKCINNELTASEGPQAFFLAHRINNA